MDSTRLALAFETVKLLQGGIIDVINLAGNDKRWENTCGRSRHSL
jgi:hypothetical protein